MNTSKAKLPCNSLKLDVLLFGDEESDEYRAHVDHIDSCHQCLNRLTETATYDDDWAKMRDFLQSRGVEGSPSHPNPIRLDFLSPPSHPEMLGRLGRYEIEEIIGAGGMGIVLKAFDTELNRRVAIKVLAPHLAHSGAARQRFAREARAAAAVVHEHVVAIHNVETEQEAPFLVMQYVPGQSLQDRVDRDGPLGAAEILRIGMQAAAGLAAAHAQGVIHRDVKPANILLEQGVERAVLTDFGLARVADDASLTHSGIVAGTPHYMSPEQARGEPTDARSDLFSLGAVLYFMATGHPPFRADRAVAVLHRICHDRHRSVGDVCNLIPDELADVIDRLLQKKAGRRFASASEAQRVMADVLRTMQQPRLRSLRSRLRPFSRRRWLYLGIAAISALAVTSVLWTAGVIGPRHEAGTVAPDASIGGGSLLADDIRAQDAEFFGQLGEFATTVESMERRSSRAGFLRSASYFWTEDLNALDVEVTLLEGLLPADPGRNPSFHSQTGEVP